MGETCHYINLADVLMDGSMASSSDLLEKEKELYGIRYAYENTPLLQVDRHFPRVEGKSFIDHIRFLASHGGVRALELGGGSSQTAALELLQTTSGVTSYVGIDGKPLSEEAKTAMKKFNCYEFMQIGISQMRKALDGRRFHIAFAHYVAEHLPNPFSMIETAGDFLEEGGLFFCNGVYIDRGILDKVIKAINAQGITIEYMVQLPSTNGVSRVDIGLKIKNKAPVFPLREQEGIRQLGEPLSTHHFMYDETRVIVEQSA